MMTDPIADMLTRIRNAVRVERPFVDIPASRVKRVGYLRLELKYGPNGERVIQSIRRISKPGRRLYSRSKELKPVLGGLGIRIISTSKGVISDREARRDKIGGEVLCEVS